MSPPIPRLEYSANSSQTIAKYYFGRTIADRRLCFRDEPLCEIGYAWESFVLGYSQFQSSSGDTMLRNWPSKVIARKYRNEGGS